jgi:ArsR family transcriptional regulator, arsenate/arsenite/antimonite-responsive transcriptional repressor
MQIERQARLYRALCEPMRLRIVRFLLTKPCTCICKLAAHLQRDQSVVYRHIEILKEAGIISTRKEGTFLMCCLRDKTRAKKLLED